MWLFSLQSFHASLVVVVLVTFVIEHKFVRTKWVQIVDSLVGRLGGWCCVGRGREKEESSAVIALDGDTVGVLQWEKATDIGPDTCWTLSKYCREWMHGMMDVERLYFLRIWVALSVLELFPMLRRPEYSYLFTLITYASCGTSVAQSFGIFSCTPRLSMTSESDWNRAAVTRNGPWLVGKSLMYADVAMQSACLSCPLLFFRQLPLIRFCGILIAGYTVLFDPFQYRWKT